jgi:hypothetical protein
MGGHRGLLTGLAVAGLAVFAAGPTSIHADSTTPSFGATYIDRDLGGGEPFVIYSHGAQDLIYSAHEGTTHIDQTYTTTPGSSCDIQTQRGFLCSYNNQLNIWYSTDGGNTWTKSPGNPLFTGFSDPSLTEDEGNNIYDTGIDLVNDALYASSDGGKTWPSGTAQCAPGDRPWLAGGKSGEVFLTTDTRHLIYHGTFSTVGPVTTLSCTTNGISDAASGQIYYDHQTGDVIEPTRFSDGGSGISVLANASNANFSGSGTPTPVVSHESSTLCANFPTYCNGGFGFNATAIDAGNTVYVVWGDGPYAATGTTGCSGTLPNMTGGTPLLANDIVMISSNDEGQTWSAPRLIAHPGTTVLWPWITAGAAGNISVVWYQGDQLTDPDCDSAALAAGGHPTKWTIQVANIFNANSPSTVYPPPSVDAVPNFDGLHAGGVMHTGGVCQSGTTCAATGQDRRLGDYFTNALDQNGCLMIATGDTILTDPLTGGQFATGRPLLLRQAGGASLTTGLPCSTSLPITTPEVPAVAALAAVAAVTLLATSAVRRRRQTGHTARTAA